MDADLRADARRLPEPPLEPFGAAADPDRASQESRPRGAPPAAEAAIADWRGFHDALRRAALAATQSGAPLSLMLLEPGGPGRAPSAADPEQARLQALAGAIAADVGGRSALARYGEQHLAVIMRETGLGDAVIRAERIGRCLCSETEALARPAIGVAQFRDDEALGHLIERTEDALDRARAEGALIAIAGPRARSARRRSA